MLLEFLANHSRVLMTAAAYVLMQNCAFTFGRTECARHKFQFCVNAC